MALDPQKLSAFANSGGPPPDAEPELDANAPLDEEEGPGKFGTLMTLLEQHADDVMALTEEFDPDALLDEGSELDESDATALQEGIDGLDEELQTELKTALPGITLDEAREMATHLSDEGIVDDAERLAGWLFRAGQLAPMGDEDTDEPEEEEEPTDDEADSDEPQELDFEE